MPGLGPAGGTGLPLGSMAENKLKLDMFLFPNWYVMQQSLAWLIGIGLAVINGSMKKLAMINIMMHMNLPTCELNFILNVCVDNQIFKWLLFLVACGVRRGKAFIRGYCYKLTYCPRNGMPAYELGFGNDLRGFTIISFIKV